MSTHKFGSGERMDEWAQKVHDLLDEMRNRMFFEYRASGAWQPKVNVYESRATYYVGVELAGLERDSIGVECVDERRIRIAGERGRPLPTGVETPFSVEVMEIDEGRFAREVELPEPISIDATEIAYDRGYLWIILPKRTT